MDSRGVPSALTYSRFTISRDVLPRSLELPVEAKAALEWKPPAERSLSAELQAIQRYEDERVRRQEEQQKEAAAAASAAAEAAAACKKAEADKAEMRKKLENFMSVTGAAEPEASKLLGGSNGDLDAAVHKYFDSRP
ncbi:unnamed protein product [Phaeothamnion confervicola]